jgi:photosystem II stability/assembly factor-like uncharacterized protein
MSELLKNKVCINKLQFAMTTPTVFITIFLCCSGLLSAQTTAIQDIIPIKPRCIGPMGIGRVNTVAVYQKNPDLIFIGAASGGVWRSLDGGNSWLPVFDDQPTQSIGAVAVDQKNPGTVWAGTGDGEPRNTISLGAGIYKSTDTGRTWRCMGLEKTLSIRRVIIDPSNSNIIYVAAMGNPFSTHKQRGLYKTEDGGKNWKLILHTNDTSGCSEIVINPKKPKELYASMYQFKRTAWSFFSGGEGSGLYKTRDGGKNWVKLDTAIGLPSGSLGNIGLAIAPSNPEVVYALVESKYPGLFRTSDGGKHWKLVNNQKSIRIRPFYFQGIVCDPKNENVIWSLTTRLQKSTDGGKTFEEMNIFHLDQQSLWISAENSSLLMVGNDGGFGISKNGGYSWRQSEQLAIAQIYHVNVDNSIFPYHVMGGLQDNGSWYGTAYGANENFFNDQWVVLQGGDGFDVLPDDDNSNWAFTLTQGGILHRTSIKYNYSKYLKPNFEGTIKLRNNWNTAIAVDPFNKDGYYYGSQFLHYGNNNEQPTKIISPDLTTNDSIKYNISLVGGLTPEKGEAEQHCTILTIAPSTVQKGVIWIGTDDGNIQLTTDNGANWNNLTDRLPDLPKGCWIPQIKPSSYSPDEAFVVANHYRLGDTIAYVYRTKDKGKTWQRIVDSEKVDGYALCIVQDPVQPNLIFVGTSKGLFVSVDDAKTFEHWRTGFPAVQVADMTIQNRESDLVIATFGRSFWVFDNIEPFRQMAKSRSFIDSPLFVFDVPVVDTFSVYRNRVHYEKRMRRRFIPRISLDDKPKGFMVSLYISPRNVKLKQDTAHISIVNSDYNHIEEIGKFPVEIGFNRLFFHLPKLEETLKLETSGKYKMKIIISNAMVEVPLVVDPNVFLMIK